MNRENLIKFPGLIDVHTHLRQMGATHKEDFRTGTMAAAAGGFTTIIDMPNDPHPTLTHDDFFDKSLTADKGEIFVDLGFHMGVSNSRPSEFHRVQDLAFSLKDYWDETQGDLWIKDIKKQEEIFKNYPNDIGRPIIVHAEGAKGSLQRAIELAKQFDQRIHIAHLSTRPELAMVRAARKEGLNITCEVSAHHLSLNHFDELTLGRFAMMRPPLGRASDVEYLWDHLDEINIFASDHAPHTRDEKINSEKVVNGVPGLDTTLPVLYTEMRRRNIPREKIVSTIGEMAHDKPQEIFKIPDQDDTCVFFDPEPTYVLNSHYLKTKCAWSPWEGRDLTGKVVRTVLRGKIIYKEGKIIGEPRGKVIYPL